MDAVLERGAVAHEVEAEAGPLAFRADVGVGQPDRRHELPTSELGEHPGVDLVRLRRQGRQALRLRRVGDRDVPAVALQGIVHEAGTVH